MNRAQQLLAYSDRVRSIADERIPVPEAPIEIPSWTYDRVDELVEWPEVFVTCRSAPYESGSVRAKLEQTIVLTLAPMLAGPTYDGGLRIDAGVQPQDDPYPTVELEIDGSPYDLPPMDCAKMRALAKVLTELAELQAFEEGIE